MSAPLHGPTPDEPTPSSPAAAPGSEESTHAATSARSSRRRVRTRRRVSSFDPVDGADAGLPDPASRRAARRRPPWRRWRWLRHLGRPVRRAGRHSFTLFATVFFILALLQRIACWDLNAAEYTDGILMIGRDLFGATYWPPLYTWLSRAFALVAGGDLEAGGRLVSMVAGAAAVIPIMWFAGEFGGATTPAERREVRAFAGLLYLASPIAWRWGIRVMSDALFLFLWWSALACLAMAWRSWREGRGLGPAFVAANVFGALSALTRHQGIFMVPLVLVLACLAVWKPRRRRRQRIRVRLASSTSASRSSSGGHASSFERRLREADDDERRRLAAMLHAPDAPDPTPPTDHPPEHATMPGGGPDAPDAIPATRAHATPGHHARARPSNRWRDVSWGALATLALWLAWPLSQAGQAAAHAGQVTYRASLGVAPGEAEVAAAGAAVIPALLALVNMTESFVYLAPYFFTPLVVLFALIGAIRRPGIEEGGAVLGLACLFLAALVLGAQGLFQSFLSRYLLPLLPIVLIYAARGLGWAQATWRRPLFLAAFGATLAHGLLFSLASLTLQREAFGDLKAAAEFVRGTRAVVPVYSNETYKEEAGMHAIKVRWWSGRDVRPIHELLQSPAPPPQGAIIVLSSAYGGPRAYLALREAIERRFGATPIGPPFESSLVPLLPDIMMGPEQGHQSPLAWVYRFQRQRFQTVVLRIP